MLKLCSRHGGPRMDRLPTLARTMTDEQGAFRLEVARQRFQDIALVPFIWAYRPGRSVAVQETVITGERGDAAGSIDPG